MIKHFSLFIITSAHTAETTKCSGNKILNKDGSIKWCKFWDYYRKWEQN